MKYAMRKTILFYIIFPLLCFTQNNENDILFSIDNNHVASEEFLRVYKKNLDLITDQSQKDIDNYLQLYIDYKLKVLEAYEKKYDKRRNHLILVGKPPDAQVVP